jgi:hypothetical protein
VHDADGRDSRHQIGRHAGWNVLGLSERRLSDEDLSRKNMDNNDFLDGIDEQFQRLMKLNGNGKRNGHPMGRSKEDRLVTEIVEHLQKFSKSQKEEVLTFIRSMEKQKVD